MPGALPVEHVAAPGEVPAFVAAPGWTLHQFEVPAGSEPPGPTLPDRAFARCAQAIRAYRFADPRVTQIHVDPTTPLLGRDILMDVQAPGLRLLAGLRIGAVLDGCDHPPVAGTTSFGIRVDTLAGHFLHGSEWIVATKAHASGEVRLRIVARWRMARLPTWWMVPGFHLFGETLRVRWRRQAARRFRALATR